MSTIFFHIVHFLRNPLVHAPADFSIFSKLTPPSGVRSCSQPPHHRCTYISSSLGTTLRCACSKPLSLLSSSICKSAELGLLRLPLHTPTQYTSVPVFARSVVNYHSTCKEVVANQQAWLTAFNSSCADTKVKPAKQCQRSIPSLSRLSCQEHRHVKSGD